MPTKPLNTDSTHTRAAVEITIPIAEINEIILMTLRLFFENRYRHATKKVSFIFDNIKFYS